jgi:hypothetical protein
MKPKHLLDLRRFSAYRRRRKQRHRHQQ